MSNKIFEKYSRGKDNKSVRMEVFKDPLAMKNGKGEYISMFQFSFSNYLNNKQKDWFRVFISAPIALQLFKDLAEKGPLPLVKDEKGNEYMFDGGLMGTVASRSNTGKPKSRSFRLIEAKGKNICYIVANEQEGRETAQGLIVPTGKDVVKSGIGLTHDDCKKIYWTLLSAWIAFSVNGEDSIESYYKDESSRDTTTTDVTANAVVENNVSDDDADDDIPW